jgi:hypothetical protein
MNNDYSEPGSHLSEGLPDVQELDFHYHILLHYLVHPLHVALLERRWRYAMVALDAQPLTPYLQNLERWGWVDRKAVSVLSELARYVSPDIAGLTDAGREALVSVSSSLGAFVVTLEELETTPGLGSPLKVWTTWAVGYALELGNTVAGAPFRYEVRWTDDAPYLADIVKPDLMSAYEVQFWPNQGQKRPRIGVYPTLSWTRRSSAQRDPHRVDLLRQRFSEDARSSEMYANLDALYWVTLTPKAAAHLSADLDWFLKETQPPRRHPQAEPDLRPDAAVFVLSALFEHWLPAPHQLRRWQGEPPTQCQAARPVYFRKRG